jgi:hypothetical protein
VISISGEGGNEEGEEENTGAAQENQEKSGILL